MSDSQNRPQSPEGEKVVMLHGFDSKELSLIVDLIKKNVSEPHKLVFASTTETSLTYTVEKWIEDLCLEKKQVLEMMRNYKKIKDGEKEGIS